MTRLLLNDVEVVNDLDEDAHGEDEAPEDEESAHISKRQRVKSSCIECSGTDVPSCTSRLCLAIRTGIYFSTESLNEKLTISFPFSYIPGLIATQEFRHIRLCSIPLWGLSQYNSWAKRDGEK